MSLREGSNEGSLPSTTSPTASSSSSSVLEQPSLNTSSTSQRTSRTPSPRPTEEEPIVVVPPVKPGRRGRRTFSASSPSSSSSSLDLPQDVPIDFLPVLGSITPPGSPNTSEISTRSRILPTSNDLFSPSLSTLPQDPRTTISSSSSSSSPMTTSTRDEENKSSKRTTSSSASFSTSQRGEKSSSSHASGGSVEEVGSGVALETSLSIDVTSFPRRQGVFDASSSRQNRRRSKPGRVDSSSTSKTRRRHSSHSKPTTSTTSTTSSPSSAFSSTSSPTPSTPTTPSTSTSADPDLTTPISGTDATTPLSPSSPSSPPPTPMPASDPSSSYGQDSSAGSHGLPGLIRSSSSSRSSLALSELDDQEQGEEAEDECMPSEGPVTSSAPPGSRISPAKSSMVDPFEYLSPELSLHVLSFLRKSTLVRLAEVNRWWKTLAYDPSLWRSLDFSCAPPINDQQLFNSFGSRLYGTRYLSFSGCKEITDKALPWLLTHAPRLEELKLSECAITDAGVAAMIHSLPPEEPMHQLEVQLAAVTMELRGSQESALPQSALDVLDGMASPPPSLSQDVIDSWPGKIHPRHNMHELALVRSGITTSSVQLLSLYYPQLTSLSVSGCHVEDDALVSLASNCHQLRHLYLSGCRRVGDKGMAAIAKGCPVLSKLNLQSTSITDRAIAAVAASCPGLEELSLAETGVTDDAARYLAQGCHELQKLYMSNCPRVGNGTLEALGQGCKALIKLVLFRCRSVSDEGVAALAAGCSQLVELNLCRCNITDISLWSLAQGCRNLEYLRMGKCVKVTDTGLAYLAESCPALTTIDLKRCAITDASVDVLTKRCPDLQALMLTKTDITPAAMTYLARLPELSRLVLRQCQYITDEALQRFSSAVTTSLFEINLAECALSDVGVITFLNSSAARALEKIDLSRSTVTDKALLELAQKCPRLTTVSLINCDNITDLGLAHLSRYGAFLTDVFLACPQVTAVGLDRLRDAFGGAINVHSTEPADHTQDGAVPLAGFNEVEVAQEAALDAATNALVNDVLNATTVHLNDIVDAFPDLNTIQGGNDANPNNDTGGGPPPPNWI